MLLFPQSNGVLASQHTVGLIHRADPLRSSGLSLSWSFIFSVLLSFAKTPYLLFHFFEGMYVSICQIKTIGEFKIALNELFLPPFQNIVTKP